MFVLCFLILFPASKALVKEYAHTFYDQVVITPLEQRSSLSEGSEIWLESVCAGGMRFDIDQGFIADGVWVEEAGKIGWRYYDQTPGMTKSLVVKVPHAHTQSIILQGNVWRGLAEISANGRTQIIDCYRDTCGTEQVVVELFPAGNIGDTVLLWLIQYVPLICMCLLVTWFVIKLWDKAKACLSERQIQIVGISLFFAALVPTVIVYLAKLSVSSTPYSPTYFGVDAAVFDVVADTWLNGGIPYRDAFDHKGPILYIVYSVGRYINPVWGVFVIQCIALYITLVISYLIGKLFRNRFSGICSVILTLLCFTLVIDEGALTEEFNLPFLMLSMYCFVKYVLHLKQRKTVEHKPIYAFVYGLTFAVSLYLRVTNAIAVCCFVFCIVVLLLIKREFVNLLHNAAAFLGGFGIVVIPIAIYFLCHGALYDMLWGTILFNLQYAAAEVTFTPQQIYMAVLYLAPVFISAALALECPGFMRYSILFSGGCLVFWMLKSQMYPHYYIICLPFVPLAVGLILKKPNHPHNKYHIVCTVAAVIVCIPLTIEAYQFAQARTGWINVLHNQGSKNQYAEVVEEECALIPEEDRNQVIGYNLDAQWYTFAGITPCYRYFTMQDWQGSHSPGMVQENIELYQSLEAKWIIVGKDGVGEPEISKVIDTYYHFVRSDFIEDGQYYLRVYQRNEKE